MHMGEEAVASFPRYSSLFPRYCLHHKASGVILCSSMETGHLLITYYRLQTATRTLWPSCVTGTNVTGGTLTYSY